MSAEVLELRDVTIEEEGRILLDGVSFRSTGERIGLSGAGEHVVQVLCGGARVSSGQILVDGVELEQATGSGVFGVATAWDAPNSRKSKLTIEEGLTLSCLLAGDTASQARLRVRSAFQRLGLRHLAEQRLPARVGLDHHFAGLLEAALFEPKVIVVKWPIGTLSEEAWGRYGTALSLLVSQRRWIVWLTGPARLPVEQAWLGALDQVIYLERGMAAGYAPGTSAVARYLLVLEAPRDAETSPASSPGLLLTPAVLQGSAGAHRAAFVAELPRDEFGRPCTSILLSWCDRHQLPILRLEPLDGIC
jgi:predicted ABC-type transport system involved in lysophospholipase L1 biosynthesis ATPase subunit